MVSEKYLQLIDRLLSKTEAGEIEWRDTAEADTFQVSFPHYSIWIREAEFESGNWDYRIGILNSQGITIDSFTDSEFNDEYSGRMAELYEKARRQALGADKALDEILNALKDAR